MALGKKTIFYMVPINLFLWSYIGYKFYLASTEKINDLPAEITLQPVKLKEDTVTYNLALNYPDPFLKEEQKNTSVQQNFSSYNSNQTNQSLSKKTNSVIPTPTKEIKYLGLVQNKTNNISTALISINGKSYLVKKGEVLEGINFESITNERITAKFGKEKVIINKS